MSEVRTGSSLAPPSEVPSWCLAQCPGTMEVLEVVELHSPWLFRLETLTWRRFLSHGSPSPPLWNGSNGIDCWIWLQVTEFPPCPPTDTPFCSWSCSLCLNISLLCHLLNYTEICTNTLNVHSSHKRTRWRKQKKEEENVELFALLWESFNPL